MKRLSSIVILSRSLLAFGLSLSMAGVSSADITNIASATFSDVGGHPFPAVQSNSVKTTVTLAGSLPTPDLSSVPNIMMVDGQVSFGYSSSLNIAQYLWIISGSGITTKNSTTTQPQLGLGQFSLAAGDYAITVQAVQSGTALHSPMASKTIRLDSQEPAPDLSLIADTIYTSDVLTLNNGSAYTSAQFVWTFAPTIGTLGNNSASGSQSNALSGIPTSAPSLNMGHTGLASGIYRLTVTVTDPNISANSATASKNITLVSVGSGLSAVQVYPNPWRKDKHDGRDITFNQLLSGSTIKIFTTSGHQVTSIPVSGVSATWNLKTDNGDAVASGMYMYLITDPQGDKAKGKLAIIK